MQTALSAAPNRILPKKKTRGRCSRRGGCTSASGLRFRLTNLLQQLRRSFEAGESGSQLAVTIEFDLDYATRLLVL
jgi:hypothetical protein